ncbi:MAG: hypothetical protein L6Q54_01775 [Leptospiraceae bacterium]|nr:hypothetical protein [Leptospiraceae bacterium]MCK6379968.1 hypothetical protein [Leptospiraceae bacterium]NUM40071.1 hypothetical protein [Leptospiraceae bacterium]
MISDNSLRHHQHNKEFIVWLILPGLVINLSIGFLFTLLIKESILEIKSVEEGDVYFYTLRIIFLSFFIFGLFVEKLIPFTQSKIFKATIVISLILEIVWNFSFASNEFVIDYIFHKSHFIIFYSLNCFVVGYILSSFKNFRMWSFLIGSLIVILYSVFSKIDDINAKDYLYPFLYILALKIGLSIFFHEYGIFFEKKKSNDRDSYSAFFYSGVILFTSHIVLVFVTPTEKTELFLSGIIFGSLLFSVMSYSGVLYEKVKIKFLIAEIFLIGNIILTANQSGFYEYSFFLFFTDLALLTFFRPFKVSKRFVTISVMVGIFISVVLIYFLPSTSSYRIRDIAVVVFAILFLFPLYTNKMIGLYHRILVLCISSILSFLFHSPFDFSKNISYQVEEEKSLIPFQLSKIPFDNNKFIYYNSDLPFEDKKKLPDKNKIQEKTLVLGIKNETNIYSSYIAELIRENIQFIVISKNIFETENFKKLQLNIVEFPMFKMYYPKYSNIDFKKSQYSYDADSAIWTKAYIFPKLKDKSSYTDIHSIFEVVEKFSSKELKEYSEQVRKIFFVSYIAYCEYFYSKKFYSKVVQSAMIAAQFGKLEANDLKILYDSILQISPELEYVSIFQMLSEVPSYREEMLKRLIPVLIATNNYEEAMKKIDELIGFYSANKRDTEIQSLRIEKAKIFLNQKDIVKAGEIILRELQQNPTSIAWGKLAEDLNLQREEIQQRWILNRMKRNNITIE